MLCRECLLFQPVITPEQTQDSCCRGGRRTRLREFSAEKVACLCQEPLDHNTCESHKVPGLQKARRNVLQRMEKAVEGPQQWFILTSGWETRRLWMVLSWFLRTPHPGSCYKEGMLLCGFPLHVWSCCPDNSRNKRDRITQMFQVTHFYLVSEHWGLTVHVLERFLLSKESENIISYNKNQIETW